VDLRWLSPAPAVTSSPSAVLASSTVPASSSGNTLVEHERALIEAALEEAKGRVSGPFGAAAKLGMPASTLESKIKVLRIDKSRFKSAPPSRSRSSLLRD
jgi:formate hydrogenlyase transcriptional activator